MGVYKVEQMFHAGRPDRMKAINELINIAAVHGGTLVQYPAEERFCSDVDLERG